MTNPTPMARRSTITIALAVALLAIGPTWSAGGSRKPDKPEAAVATPEQNAAEYYNRALDQHDRASALESRAAAADDEATRAKLVKRVRDSHENAIEELRRAVAADPNMHEAWSSLGYSYRQTGRYAEALASYDRALALDPEYTEAIEYRAEAYLGLGRIDDAKEAHAVLAANNPARASQLLDAMRAWIDQQRSSGGGASASDLDALASWIAVRRSDRTYPAQGPSKARTW